MIKLRIPDIIVIPQNCHAGAVNRARKLLQLFRFGIMEQQTGANGWNVSMEAPTPRPGQMTLWTMQSIAHGADFISYFRWRTCPFGTEMYWHRPQSVPAAIRFFLPPGLPLPPPSADTDRSSGSGRGARGGSRNISIKLLCRDAGTCPKLARQRRSLLFRRRVWHGYRKDISSEAWRGRTVAGCCFRAGGL